MRQSHLTIEQIVAIRTPDTPVWAPDGSRLAYRLAGFGGAELWVSDLRGAPRQLTRGDGPAGAPVWDDQTLLFLRGGALRRVTLDGDESVVLALPAGARRPVILPGGKAVAYVMDGDVYLREVVASNALRVTRGEWLMTRPYHVLRELLVPAPDGRRLAIVAPRERGTDLAVFDRETGELTWVEPSEHSEINPVWSRDGSRLAFTRHHRDVKWRELLVYSPASGVVWRVHTDRDERFVPRAEFQMALAPDGSQVAFVAPWREYGSLQRADVGGEGRRLLSDERGECEQPAWSPTGERVAYVSTLPMAPVADARVPLETRRWCEKHLFVTPDVGGAPVAVTAGACVVESFRWSPDGRRIASIASTPDAPNRLFVHDLLTGEVTLVAAYQPDDLALPEVDVTNETVPSEDGCWRIPTLLFSRRDLPPDGTAPGLVYVHGGGMGQYALAGWGSYTDKGTIYASCLLLAQHGYVVALPDYRGSWGYGTAYEQASYLDVGGGDNRDVIATAHWLAARPEVDGHRLGIWGRSFGGFSTVQALVSEPRLFRAGVNLVGVFDWRAYYDFTTDRFPGSWIVSRFGRPDDQPALYVERNPLSRIERLSAPLLTLHGTADANVPIDEAWKLTSALLKADKDFEMVIYPDEPHIFTRPETWRDALRRTVRFFGERV